MNIDEFKAMLDKEYTITVRGSVLAYLINLLSDTQHRLNDEAQDNITNITAVMTAAANDIVGNEMLHAIKNAAGCEFLDTAMNAKPGTMAKIFKDDSKDIRPHKGRLN